MAIKWHLKPRLELLFTEAVLLALGELTGGHGEHLLEDPDAGLVADLGDRAFAKLRNYS
jgi:hypothetical protein